MSTKNAKSTDDSYSCVGVVTNVYYQVRCQVCGCCLDNKVEFVQGKNRALLIKIPPRCCTKCEGK